MMHYSNATWLVAAALALAACSGGGSSPGRGPVSANATTPVDCSDPNLSQKDWIENCSTDPLLNGGTVGPSGISTEGDITTPDGSFVKYPDGGLVRVAAVEPIKSHRCAEGKRGDTCLLVQVSLKNEGLKTIEFDTGFGTPNLDLYYGENGYPSRAGSYIDDPDVVSFPRRCVPGSTVTAGALFAVPATDLDHLELTFNAQLANGKSYTPYTFTNVQTLLP